MYKYEITKYNPIFRSKKDGRTYLKNEWISICDIGECFEGLVLSEEEYKKTEDSYVKAIEIIMNYMNIDYVIIDNIKRWSKMTFNNKHVKDYPSFYNKELLRLCNNVQNKDKLDIKKTIDFCRLRLREDAWASMFYPRRLKIYFGYDYYMHVHTSISLDKIKPQIESLGLFMEKDIYNIF